MIEGSVGQIIPPLPYSHDRSGFYVEGLGQCRAASYPGCGGGRRRGAVGEGSRGSTGCIAHVGAEVRRRQRNMFMLPSIILEKN